VSLIITCRVTRVGPTGQIVSGHFTLSSLLYLYRFVRLAPGIEVLGEDMSRLVSVVVGCCLCFGALSAAAGPIVVSLMGELGANSPYGASGTPYTFSFQLDDSTQPVELSADGTSASFDGAVTGTTFDSELTSLSGAPTNAAADSNLILVFDDLGGSAFSEDTVQAFFDVPDQGRFTDLFFGFLLLDRHEVGEDAPTSVASLGLDLFSGLDAADFVRDLDGPLTANNQFVFSGVVDGIAFSDFTSTITSISVAPGQTTVPPTVPPGPLPMQPPAPFPTPPVASPVTEPSIAGLLLLGLVGGVLRRRKLADA